jgi:hypothetical protein
MSLPERLKPNTEVIFMQPPKRPLGDWFVLALLAAMALAVALIVRDTLGVSPGYVAPVSTSATTPTVEHAATPVIFRAILELPAPTSTPTPKPSKPVPTRTPNYAETLPQCEDAKDGEVCVMVEVPRTATPTPVQVCNSAFIVSDPANGIPCIKPTGTPNT